MSASEIPLEAAEHRRRARRARFGELEYARFTDGFRGVPRGTVVAGDDVLWGYPSIGRVLSLEAGLAEQFGHRFWLEEKIDGYNVRIGRVGEQILAFSRGGFACPFSNDRLPELLELDVFEHEPDLVLCAEIAGPDNPYVAASPPHVTEDVQLFVFDVMRKGRSEFLGPHEKQAVVDRYGLPAARSFGRFSIEDFDRIERLVDELDAEGCEGVVIKDDDDPGRRAKYVTGGASIHDIAVSARELMDQPADFFVDRVLRLALHLADQDREPGPELEQALGRAFLDGLLEQVRRFPDERRVSRTYRCRFRDRENAEAYMRHIARAPENEVQVLRSTRARTSSMNSCSSAPGIMML